jgi:two-component system response regulator GlrR
MPTYKGFLLLVDDDPDLLKLLAIRLKASGYRVTTADSGERALALLAAERPDIVITDLRMTGIDGMQLFREIEASHGGLPVIILTAHGTIPEAVAATRQGVFGYLTKPYDPNDLLTQIEQALRIHGTAVAEHNNEDEWREAIVTRSPLMEDLLARAQRVAQGDASILIQGESGTGKELLARALHLASRRATGPFVAVNCGAIPEALLESELFGHKKGSFTGAIGDHRGLFLDASGGTLFLDEIGDMPLPLQVKLLRVLEMREVRPVGSTKTVPVDVRIISATHRDLTAAKTEGTFREDLYYRLNVVTLRIPTLAERREDIPLLAQHFLKHIGDQYNNGVKAFSPEAMELMVTSSWPGNIRQLYNVVEQAVALTHTEIVPAKWVEQAMQVELKPVDSFEDARRRFERDYLTRLLKLTEGSVSQAARLAKRNRTEFYKLLQRHGLEPAAFKTSVE